MNKLIYLIGLILITLTVWCGSNQGTTINNQIIVEDSKTSNNSNENNSTNEESNTETIQDNSLTQKQYYLNRINQLQIEEENYISSSNPQSTSEIVSCNNYLYTLWDNLLNEIWSQLKNQLPSNEMKALTISEKAWIKEKESKANEAMAQYGGGTAGNIEYSASLLNSTKERCYFLVENYMK